LPSEIGARPHDGRSRPATHIESGSNLRPGRNSKGIGAGRVALSHYPNFHRLGNIVCLVLGHGLAFDLIREYGKLRSVREMDMLESTPRRRFAGSFYRRQLFKDLGFSEISRRRCHASSGAVKEIHVLLGERNAVADG
jgi:hypothetical protein